MALDKIDFKLERDLQFEIENHITVGKLIIGGLEWLPEKNKWACNWSISFIHPENGRLYGDDPLSALTVTVDFLSCFIRGSEIDGLRVWWRIKGDHAGLTFPLCEGKKWETQ